MTTTANTIARRFNREFADQPESSRIHSVIDALCAHARNLAPAFGEETMQAGATNVRPDAVEAPRKALAFDCVVLAHQLNSFSDQEDLVALWFDRGFSAQDLEAEAQIRDRVLAFPA